MENLKSWKESSWKLMDIYRGYIKGWQPGKLTGCQLDHAWLLLLLNQVVFLQESVNINNLFPPIKTEYPPVQNLDETPAFNKPERV